MRRLLIAVAVTAALLAFPGSRPAHALPHGCASVSNDYSADADVFRRRFGTRIRHDEPCTYFFEAGDTFTGRGRFLVTCESGGYFFHPDQEGDGPEQEDTLVPVPQPCAVGALVTVDGYRALTGGSVVSGGLGEAKLGSLRPSKEVAQRASRGATPNSDFAALCDPGSPAVAEVNLTAPVARSGFLGFSGTIDCRGASVTITRLVVSGVGGFPFPQSAPRASCHRCHEPLVASDTTPVEAAAWQVEMDFEVARHGKATVHAYRVGRYVTSWAGHVTTLYPTPADDGSLIV